MSYRAKGEMFLCPYTNLRAAGAKILGFGGYGTQISNRKMTSQTVIFENFRRCAAAIYWFLLQNLYCIEPLQANFVVDEY